MFLLRKGAEADLYKDSWYGLNVIKKVRNPKEYRIPQLDQEIRRTRTVREAQIIHVAKTAGVPTPFIYLIDTEAATIIMQYIEGQRVRELLGKLSLNERKRLCKHIGILIGKLHRNGIVHGDLTTSNIIVAEDEKVFFIDFGLAEYSEELEKRGVDILLMKRSLQATHYSYSKECFDAIVEGYTYEMKESASIEILKRVEEIARRGRYAVER